MRASVGGGVGGGALRRRRRGVVVVVVEVEVEANNEHVTFYSILAGG